MMSEEDELRKQFAWARQERLNDLRKMPDLPEASPHLVTSDAVTACLLVANRYNIRAKAQDFARVVSSAVDSSLKWAPEEGLDHYTGEDWQRMLVQRTALNRLAVGPLREEMGLLTYDIEEDPKYAYLKELQGEIIDSIAPAFVPQQSSFPDPGAYFDPMQWPQTNAGPLPDNVSEREYDLIFFSSIIEVIKFQETGINNAKNIGYAAHYAVAQREKADFVPDPLPALNARDQAYIADVLAAVKDGPSHEADGTDALDQTPRP